jgi:hypothetical protein
MNLQVINLAQNRDHCVNDSERNSELPDSVRGGEFPNQLRHYKLLKKDSAA